MPMTSVRRAVLTGTGLVLAGWLVYDMSAEGGAAPAMPELQPELVGGMPVGSDGAVGAGAAAAPLTGQAAPQGAGRSTMDGGTSASAVVREGAGGWMSGGDLTTTLDRVFAPDRTAYVPSTAAVPDAGPPVAAPAGQAEDGSVPVVVGGGVAPAVARTSEASSGASEAAHRREPTEDAYYQAFLAVARADVHELERQANAVLTSGGEDCRKVAVLRALYNADRSHAVDYFARAIATLPDVSRPEAVSVPAFAIDFLAKHASDPAARLVVERIASSESLNVPANLRQQAAAALKAQATPEDLPATGGGE